MSSDGSITSLSEAVEALGALPMPAGPAPKPLSAEWRVKLAALIGDAKPARDGLLTSFGESIRDRREHDHTTQREDWFCMNLSAYMGERMAPVLRRLLDAEARVAELEAELLVANGVLEDVARARRSGVACPCPSVDRPHQVGCPEDGVPVASFAERAARETDLGRRAAYRMLAEPEPEFHAFLHHENRVGHDLPETGGTQ